MTEEPLHLEDGDFRIERVYINPAAFYWGGQDAPEAYPPPSDLIDPETWLDVMGLPTDVALKTTSKMGSTIARIQQLNSDWTFSWAPLNAAPFVEMPAVFAGEEFDALIFNAMHGYYRQAIAGLRVALELMTIATGFAVTGNAARFAEWREGRLEGKFGVSRQLIADSAVGKQIDAAGYGPIFTKDDSSWMKARYKRLCGFAHAGAGFENSSLWSSNGPIFVATALETVENELRETLALCYLLLRLGWPTYKPGRGQQPLLDGPQSGWAQYDQVLRHWLL
jgi:hypothetical protein